MAGLNRSLQSSSTIDYLFTNLDINPSHFPSDHLLHLRTTDCFLMERGPRYKAYADLRESKLRLKNKSPLSDPEQTLAPPRKHVKFQGTFTVVAATAEAKTRRKASSVMAQSVPDFGAVLRKENRKPAQNLTPVTEKSMTPPARLKSSRMYGIGGKSGGSKSVNTGEKQNGGIMGRKSYANFEELKGFSSAAANAINNSKKNGRAPMDPKISHKTDVAYIQEYICQW